MQISYKTEEAGTDRSPTGDKLNEVKIFRAKARRTNKGAKRKSWTNTFQN